MKLAAMKSAPVLNLVFLLLASLPAWAEIYSRSAVLVWGAPAGRVVGSPNGKSAVRVLAPDPNDPDGYARVVVDVDGHAYSTPIGSWVNAEIGWGADSKKFFVTFSDGGNVGTYHVKIVMITHSGLHISEPLPNGRKLLVPHCFSPERPNVGAMKWVGPSRLLVAVEVPPHSSCASMGTFRAFEIELPSGKVMVRYGQVAAKRMFRDDLGSELQGADDNCAVRPQDCIPTGLNPSAGARRRVQDDKRR